MKLLCLDNEVYSKLNNKPVCIIFYSEAHIKELCNEYNIYKNICGVVDDYERIWGKQKIGGYEFEVTSPKLLDSLPKDAVLLIACYRPKEAFEWLKTLPQVQDKFPVVYFYPDKELRYDIQYREKYKNTALGNIILFCSGPGITNYSRNFEFADNARALFDYMLDNHYDDNYELVWLVKEPSEYNERYRQYQNVKFLAQESAWTEDEQLRDEYYRVLCLAKYIFFTDACAFVRNAREDQVRVQLWHGQGFKARVMKNNREGTRYDYMTVSSEFYADLHAKIFYLRRDQLIITGLPKEDWLFKPRPNWQELFNIPKANKYVFWLPTFRTHISTKAKIYNENIHNRETGLSIIATPRLLQQLNDFLSEHNVVVVIKLHPVQDKSAITDFALSNIVLIDNDDLANKDVQINELLGHADAIISDYSSIAVDYMLLNRPIAFALDDYEEYNSHRGFVMDNVKDYLPGEELYNFEDFKQFIQNVVDGKDLQREKRQRLNKLYHNFFDGQSSRRVIEALGIKR